MRTQLDTIPQGDYTGYYWLSDAEFPIPVSGNFPDDLLKPLPLVAEANLYDATTNRSISVRHNGERHVIQQYDLKGIAGFEKNEVFIITHRLPQKGRAIFWELWRETEDPLCNNFKTLKPYGRVFVGFENN